MAVLTMNSTQMNFTLANKNQAIEVLLADHSINLNSIMGLIWNHDEKTIDQHLFELAKV